MTTPIVSKGKTFTPRVITSHYPEKDFIYFLNRPLEKFTNANKFQQSRKFPFFTPKGHPIVCWVICIILQLQSTEIENARTYKIDTINTIDIINFINQHKDNRYNWYDQLTLQTSPKQLHHCCFVFRFALLIKVRSGVVLQPVSSC